MKFFSFFFFCSTLAPRVLREIRGDRFIIKPNIYKYFILDLFPVRYLYDGYLNIELKSWGKIYEKKKKKAFEMRTAKFSFSHKRFVFPWFSLRLFVFSGLHVNGPEIPIDFGQSSVEVKGRRKRFSGHLYQY